MFFRFDPLIFLEIAKILKDNGNFDDAGIYRTCVGRAYYAAFLYSRERTGQKFDSEGQHKAVREYYKFIKRRDDIADFLNQLFDLRVDADYKLNKKITKTTCEHCITLSDIIITQVNNL